MTGRKETFLYAAQIIVIVHVLSAFHILLELHQLYRIWLHYFFSLENYLELFVYIGAIVFALQLSSNQCWCASTQIWQLGAAVILCAWSNFIFILQQHPWSGAPISLLLTICKRYLKLVYLPTLLAVSFGLPFYMLLVVNTVSEIKYIACNMWILPAYEHSISVQSHAFCIL